MATFFEGIDLRQCAFPLKPSGEVKWAYTSPYGPRWLNGQYGFHNGDDIGSAHYPYYQSPYNWVLPAIMAGEVHYNYDPRSGNKAHLETDHGTFIYCHMQSLGTARTVNVGESVGLCGGSGGVPAHLHFIWWDADHPLPTARNPRPLLDAIASARWPEHVTPPPVPTLDLKELEEMAYPFVVDQNPENPHPTCYISNGKLIKVHDPGELDLLFITGVIEKHPLSTDGVAKLDWNNEQHRGACNAFYDHYVRQLNKSEQYDERPQA